MTCDPRRPLGQVRSWPLLALASSVLMPALADAKGGDLAAWASRHWREDPKLLREAGGRALEDTWKVSDQLLKVERFFVDRPLAYALRSVVAQQVRVGGCNAALVDTAGRILVGTARAAYAGLEPGLSPAERLEHRRRAAEILKTVLGPRPRERRVGWAPRWPLPRSRLR